MLATLTVRWRGQFYYLPEKFEDVSSAAPREGERGAMIVEILTKSFPITTLLILISTAGRGGCCSLLVVVDAVVIVVDDDVMAATT